MQEQNNLEKKQAKSSSKKTPSLLFTVNKKGEHSKFWKQLGFGFVSGREFLYPGELVLIFLS